MGLDYLTTLVKERLNLRVELEVPEKKTGEGLSLVWDSGYEITVSSSNHTIHIAANVAGLRSLARHLLALASESVPAGYHVHLDESNSLDDGSCELIIERR